MKGIVVLSCWVLGALQGAILILIPEMMAFNQVTALQLAVPLALGTFVFMVSSGRWGQLLDTRVVEKKSLILVIQWVLFGFMLSQLSFVILLQFSALQGSILILALCVSRVLHGLFCSAIIPSAQLHLSRGDKRGEKLVWASIATNIGRLTAPLLTFIPVDISYLSLWIIISVTAIAWVATLLIGDIDSKLSSASVNRIAVKENSVDKNIIISPAATNNETFTFFKKPLLICVCTTAVLISIFSSQLQFSLGPLLLVRLADVASASEMTATILFAASASALVSLFIIYKPLSRSPKLFLITITAGLGIGTYLFVLQEQLILSVALISAALSMAPAWYTALAMRATTKHKARTSAAVSQGHTLGNAFGGLLGGGLLALGNGFLLSSFILFMILIVIGWAFIANLLGRLKIIKNL